MSGNGEYGTAREDVLAEIREQAWVLASRGVSTREIAHRLDHGLTATEHELLAGIVRQAAAEARITPAQEARETHSPLDAGPRDAITGGIGRSLVPVVPVVVAAVAVGVLVGLALSNRGHEGGNTSSGAGASGAHRSERSASPGNRAPAAAGRRRSASSPPKSSPSPPPSQAPGSPPQGTATSRTSLTSAAELNDRGFQLMNGGRYEEAIPLLRRAVSASKATGNDLTNAYALFNLGRSLRLVGRPQEAIPVLEQRLQIDNQRATVSRELRAAKRSVHSTGGAR
jgi:tetratricopeptide (TPR) repeat protein